MTTSHHQNGYHFISQRLWEYDPLFHATEKYWLEYQITPKAYCNICYDYYPMKTMWQDCPSNSNEHYCSNCLKQYLSSKISVGQVYADNSVACPCSTSACAGRIKENIILYLLENDSSLIEKFHIFSLNAEVASSTNKTFCPNSQCGAVVTITSSWSKQVSCSKCQIKFCFNCRESHNPWITCSMSGDMKFKKWRQTTLQGCKRCPQCHMYIEKNEGCMHMTCCKCRHEFCWECMSSWKGSCSAPSFYHNSARILNNDIWGQSLSTRVVSKSIGIPIICAVGCGLGGLAFGAASVAAACVIASTPIAAGVYLYNNPPRPLRKLYYRMTGEAKTSISEIRSIVQYGIIISLPWRYDDPNYIMTLRGMRSDEPAILPNSGFITNGVHNTNPTFMGIPGRICHSIFVGYMTHSSISSFVAYFIPSECPLEQIDELQLRTDDIVRIPYPSSHVPYSNYREEDGVVLQQLFHHIQIAAALA